MGGTVYQAEDVAGRLAAEIAKGECAVKLLTKEEGLGYGLIVTQLANRDPKPEMHDAADDVYYVLEGQGTLYLGGEMQGVQETSPGEYIGESVDNPAPHELGPGDVVSIPRKTVHMMGCPGGSVKYLVVKVY